LEGFFFLLLNFANKVIELESLLVINTDYLIRSRLQNWLDSLQGGNNSDMLCKFWSTVLATVL